MAASSDRDPIVVQPPLGRCHLPRDADWSEDHDRLLRGTPSK